jgi:serine/threonine protein phosphatase PrpC
MAKHKRLGQVATLDVGSASERGLRDENQDRTARFRSTWGEIVVVADGMGGCNGGAAAADAVVRELPNALERAGADVDAVDALSEAVISVNREVYERGHGGDPSVANMGSTIVLALIREDGDGLVARIANVGDSRAYLYRNGSLNLLSKDHTVVQRLVDAGVIAPSEARSHADSFILTRSLGQSTNVAVEISPSVALKAGDVLLLCSDGLSSYVEDNGISGVLDVCPDPNAAVKALVDLALSNGSNDNITVQVIRVAGQRGFWSWFLRRRIAASIIVAAILSVAAWGVGRLMRRPPDPREQELQLVNHDAPNKGAEAVPGKDKSKKDVVRTPQDPGLSAPSVGPGKNQKAGETK